MKLPDDYEGNSTMTPTVIAATIAVTLFVAAVLVVVLIMNNDAGNSRRPASSPQPSAGSSSPVIADSDKEEPSRGSLHPGDLDFWGMYPQPTEEPQPTVTDPPREVVETDPSTDGRHTLIRHADGTEEWVLISPSLPGHGLDFTRLVCQSGLMKYYEDGRKVSFVGVDISEAQKYIDFVKVKKAGIDFCMIRAGARGYGSGQLIEDEYFAENLKRATDAGLEAGVYFFSQAVSEEEAVEEAGRVLEQLKEYKITYPIAFDMERIPNDTSRIENLTRAQRTSIAKAFLDTVAAAGYKGVIYGNKEWLIKEIDLSKLTAYDTWLSQQGDMPDYPYRFGMWQYSFDGSVEGIAGKVNLNISFIDYSEK